MEEDNDEDGHTVVATARGVFSSNGGVLSSIETGVSIIIPQGAIPEGVEQEIYFKVCRDNSILPPLDKEKGNGLALLSLLNAAAGSSGEGALGPCPPRWPRRAAPPSEASSEGPAGVPGSQCYRAARPGAGPSTRRAHFLRGSGR